MPFIAGLSQLIGCDESALRLLTSICLGYPIACFHRRFLFNATPFLHHIYFTFTGLCLGYFNNGFYIGHPVLCIAVQWLLLKILPPKRRISLALSFIFQFSYLLAGYLFSQTDGYDINWCTPHCVLTLRLIAVAFDLYDGQKSESRLSPEQKETCLVAPPTLIELFGHALFPSTYLVGPLFSHRRYLKFAHNELHYDKNADGRPACVRASLCRFGLGACYLVMHQALTLVFGSETYFHSQEFLDSMLISKLFWMGCWCRVIFMRYLAVWLLAEGACIMFGITYSGVANVPSWQAMRNIHVYQYETATTFQEYVTCFNVNTNRWVSKYVFKRLRFLGSKELSQLISLMFLAIWHGYHLGYFVVFLNEFMIIVWERKISQALSRHTTALTADTVSHRGCVWRLLSVLWYCARRVYVHLFLGYACVPFIYVTTRRWLPVLVSMRFCGHAMFLSWPLLVPLIHRWVGPALSRCGVLPSAESPVTVTVTGPQCEAVKQD